MRNVSLISLILLFVVSFVSCENEEDELLAEIERVLPGDWNIDSVRVLGNPDLVYQGIPIPRDTSLSDIGLISIPSFNIASLSLEDKSSEFVEAELLIGQKLLYFNIEKLLLSEDFYFAYLRQSSNLDVDSPEGQFIQESSLFNTNHYLQLIDDNTLMFFVSSKERIYLSRN